MIVPRGTTGRSLFVDQTTLSHSLPPKKIRWNLKKRAPWTGNQFIFKSFTFGSMASLLGMQWPNGITSTIFQSIELLCIFCSELKKQENMNKLQLELENVGRYALPLTSCPWLNSSPWHAKPRTFQESFWTNFSKEQWKWTRHQKAAWNR